MAPKKRRTPKERARRAEPPAAQPPLEDLSTGSPDSALPLSPEMGDSGQRMLNMPVGVHTGPTPRSPEAPWLPPDVGDETGDESSPRPDENVVDEIGDETGLRYGEGEPMHTVEKRDERDRNRWELDPASSEDFERRQATETRDDIQEGGSQQGEPTQP